MLKKILYLVLILLAVGGFVAGLVITLSSHAWVMALSTLILGAFAYPTVKKLVGELTA